MGPNAKLMSSAEAALQKHVATIECTCLSYMHSHSKQWVWDSVCTTKWINADVSCLRLQMTYDNEACI